VVVGLTVLEGDGKPEGAEAREARADAEPAYSEGC
jgi:hypothetical protein